jgi:hypothetical protein
VRSTRAGASSSSAAAASASGQYEVTIAASQPATRARPRAHLVPRVVEHQLPPGIALQVAVRGVVRHVALEEGDVVPGARERGDERAPQRRVPLPHDELTVRPNTPGAAVRRRASGVAEGRTCGARVQIAGTTIYKRSKARATGAHSRAGFRLGPNESWR